MPRYKRGSGYSKREARLNCRSMVGRLRDAGIIGEELPPVADEDDDMVDAYVAWRMGKDFLRGKAIWAGSPEKGGFVVPEDAALGAGFAEP